MRYVTAWANTITQNVSLKFIVIILSVCLVASLGATIKLSLRDPLVIERGCFSRVLPQSPSRHTKEEIEAFLREALAIRFNSGIFVKPGFISLSEEQLKDKENLELSHRNLTQVVVFNSVQINNGDVVIDADRLFSIGKVRSAFIFKLGAKLLDTQRTESNPYGLILDKVTPLPPEKESK